MLTNVWSQVVLVLYTRVRETRRFCTGVLNTTYFSNESDDYECVESIGICTWHTGSRNTPIYKKHGMRCHGAKSSVFFEEK